MDDQELITAIENVQKGIDAEENFSFIYHRSHLYTESRIRFYVHGRKTASYDVEDITQDVYIYMSTHLSALKDPKAFWSWADKIAAGKTNDFFDSRQGKTIVNENTLEIQTDEDNDRNPTVAHDIVDSKISNNPEQQAMQNATVAAVQEILADLTDAQKEVIIPFFLYNKKEREIAEELNLNLNTVKSRLKSGKDAIYKRKADLRKRGVEIAVIPFVLLLHIAYRSDEALAATLTAGMAASGIAKSAFSHGTSVGVTDATGAKTSAEAVASASKAAGMSKAAAVGEAGATKAAGTIATGIAVKAVAAVAAVAVAAGGAIVCKSVTKMSSSTVQPSTYAAGQDIDITQKYMSDTAEPAETPGAYAYAYGPAVNDFVSRHNVPLDDVTIRLSDFDEDGLLEMIAYYKTSSNKYTSLYTMSDGTANLIVDAESCWVYKGITDGKIYIRAIYPDGQEWTEGVYLLSHSSVSPVATITVTTRTVDKGSIHYQFDNEAADKDSQLNDLIGNDQIRPKDIPEIKYSQLISCSDEQLINTLANYKY